MSTLKDRALSERVTLPFDDSHLWTPDGKLRVIDRTPGPIQRTPSGLSVQKVYSEVQFAPSMSRFGLGFTGPRALPLAVANTDSPVSTANASSYTFTAAALGAAASGRKMFVCAGGRSAGSGGADATITGVTLGGNAMSLVVESGPAPASDDAVCSIWRRTEPTGTTADIVVTWSEAVVNTGISVYQVLNSGSDTPHNTNFVLNSTATGNNLNLNTTDNCVVIAYGVESFGTTRTCTWVGANEDVDEAIESNNCCHSSASQAITAVETPRTISFTWSGGISSASGVAATII